MSLTAFQPLLTAAPAVLLPAAILSDGLGLTFKSPSLRQTGSWASLYAGISAPVAAFAALQGFSPLQTSGSPQAILYQNLALALAGVLLVLGLWRIWLQRGNRAGQLGVYLPVAILAFGLLLLQYHLRAEVAVLNGLSETAAFGSAEPSTNIDAAVAKALAATGDAPTTAASTDVPGSHGSHAH